MKTPKILRFADLALAVLIGLGPVAAVAQTSNAYYFWWQVTDEYGQPYTGQNVACSVYDPNGPGAKTLHTTSALDSGNRNPLFSDVNGKLHFYSTSNQPVDVVCRYTQGGNMTSVNRLTLQTHRIVVDRHGRQVAWFAVNQNPGITSNATTGVTIPGGAVVRDVIIQNLAPAGVTSAFHISVGFGGNHAVAQNQRALVDAQALTSPDEWLRPHMVCTGAAASAAQCLLGGANHRGTAISFFHAQITVNASVANASVYREIPYIVHTSTGLDVVYGTQVPASQNARLHVFILYDLFHTKINRLGLTN